MLEQGVGAQVREILEEWQLHFVDKEDFSQAKFADKESFSRVPTSTGTNGVLQICRQAKCFGRCGTPYGYASGKVGQHEQKGTNLHGHFFGTQSTSLKYVRSILQHGLIFHRVIDIVLSTNYIMYVYIAYSIYLYHINA